MTPRIRRIALIGLGSATIMMALAARLLWPAQSVPTRADAIVVFAGGHGERIERALDLAGMGVAPVVVISQGVEIQRLVDQAKAACTGAYDFTVWCVVADPDSTRGEAALFAELATENGWSDLVAVTTTYHVTRAAMLLDRCYDGTLSRVGATPRSSRWSLPRLLLHEIGGLAQALTMKRGC